MTVLEADRAALVALGDSFTCGEGVGVTVPADQVWSALLAADLGLGYLSLARPGARVRDVRHGQLPGAPAAPVATVLVGLNDVARAGFDPDRVAADFRYLVAALAVRSGAVVVGRLHDPGQLLGLPTALRRRLDPRIEAMNAVIDQVAPWPSVAVLDLPAVPLLAEARGWAVDRVHPSAAGHAAMAAAAGDLLRDKGFAVSPRHVPAGVDPGRLERAHWLVRHAAPYLSRNVRTFATPVVTDRRLPD